MFGFNIGKWFASLFTPPAAVDTTPEVVAVEREIDEDVVEACGKLAIARLTGLWKQDIYDPRHTDQTPDGERCRAAILDIITNGGGWRWVKEYTGDGSPNNEQWCGFTQAWAWAPWIAEDVRKTWWASTYRLDAWARYAPLDMGGKITPNPKPASGPYRLYAKLDEHSTSLPFTPQAGDILLVGDGKPAYGDHVCGVRGYDEKRRMFLTIEGNGMGAGPDGKRQHGLVIAERPLGQREGHAYIARRLIRPAPHDIVS